MEIMIVIGAIAALVLVGCIAFSQSDDNDDDLFGY
jgi:hypothetical protein